MTILARSYSGNLFKQGLLTQKWSLGRPLVTQSIKDKITMTAHQDSYVASKWEYPSDHLPIAATLFEGMGKGVSVGSWNVLNSAYMHHVVKPSWQDGYYMNLEKESSIHYEGLSKREEDCCRKIKALILTNSHSLNILCIQECSSRMFSVLKEDFSKLSSSDKVEIFKSDGANLPGNRDVNNHVVTLIKTSSNLQVINSFSRVLWQRKFMDAETKKPGFGPDHWRPGLFLEVESTSLTGKKEKVIVGNVHISCAGESDEFKRERCEELSSGVNDLLQDATVVLAGDYNTSSSVIQQTGLKEYEDLVDEFGHVDAKTEVICKIDKILTKPRDKVMKDYYGARSFREVDCQAAKTYEEALAPVIAHHS